MLDYFIRSDYQHRTEPQYDNDLEHEGIVWQPDVYTEAARLAGLVGASCIVDVGCGGGRTLAALHPRFDVVGMDLPGPNLEECRARAPHLEWIEHDIESDLPLPVPEVLLTRSVVVSSDVIEHLLRPERLLVKLRSALAVAHAVVLSTPDRELTWGPDHAGPPPNPSHVREWSTRELAAFLDGAGFGHRIMTLTRSNDRLDEKKTILCRLFRDSESLRVAAAGDEEAGSRNGGPEARPAP